MRKQPSHNASLESVCEMSSRSRTGFALPIVLMLVLVGGIAISVMMERHVAQAMTVQRELQGYSFHHSSKGVQEAVETWLRYSGATKNMHDAVTSDGHAFDIVLDTGETVRVTLVDAQDTILAELAGLPAQSRDVARLMLEELQIRAGVQASQLTRREGPVPVSVNSAPPDVLYAAINAITDGQETDALVDEINHRRSQEPLTTKVLTDIYTTVSISSEVRGKIAMAITAQPTLWRVIAELQPSVQIYPPPPTRRFCGLVLLNTTQANPQDRRAQLNRNSMIIDWQDCSDPT